MRRGRSQRFSEEFRREAVRLARDPKQSVPALAAELGISVTTLRNWLRAAGPEPAVAPARVVSLEEQVRRLQRENDRLREEREILKKATAFFAKGAR
jgi:transposase